MSKILLKRGNNSTINNYTGDLGEIVIDTTNKTVVVQDGSTKGGVVLAKKSDIPAIPTKTSQLTNDSGYITSAQGLTVREKWSSGLSWCRVYNDGFIEQGGELYVTLNGTNVTFHKAFSNTNYNVVLGNSSGTESDPYIRAKTTTILTLARHWSGSEYGDGNSYWRASGY